jgi:hypothetical protein
LPEFQIHRAGENQNLRARVFFFETGLRFAAGGAQINPSSFMPSGSAK